MSTQLAQSGAQLHASIGAHCPDQQSPLALIVGSVPGPQVGGSDLQITPFGLQLIFENVQRPNRHTGLLSFRSYVEHVSIRHSMTGQSAGTSPAAITSQ